MLNRCPIHAANGAGSTARSLHQRFLRKLLLALLLVVWLSGESHAAESAPLELRQGDRIAILGNGLADRMQHDGWLETYLQARFPEKELVVRHLGFTGDELTIRMRSAGFGSPEDWLKRTEASVVFAFFGYNESFRDEAGLGQFKKDLVEFVKKTRAPDDDGKSTRRVVLFSPIGYEDLGDRLLPSGEELNRRLLTFTRAMNEVATELQVPFVNLYQPSLESYAASNAPLTINGVHLNEAGNREIASIAGRGLFGEVDANDAYLQQLRAAVLDKNFHWFQRYRTTDGYAIFGGRRGTGGSQWTPTNEPVMKREMEVLDVMTANRDQKIWAAAQSKGFTVDDSNTPPLIPVATNVPGPLGDGSYPFLSGEAAIEKMTLADGMAVNLFASEEQFPELQNPVQAAVDAKGRLWVAAWPSYPHWNPKDEMNDKLLILEDTDGDGKADNCKVFADGLHNPTGFEFYDGGVYVAQIPDIWFFKDTDGDDVADVKKRVVGGIDSADTHHSINSFVLGPGGGLHFQEGLFHRTQVETPHGPPVRVADAGVFRYDPRSQEFQAYANYRFMNPHGHVFNYWGDDVVHDGTSAEPFFGPAISGRTNYPAKHRGAPNIYERHTRPCAATMILSSKQFPERNRDTLLVCNVIGEQGVLQYRLEENGAGLEGIEIEPLVMSSDRNFRPVDLEVGNDGAIYLLDWQNPIIGHLQHNLRDANRDHRHGRIYRIRSKDRPLVPSPPIAEQPLDQLFELLKHRDNGIRYRAKIELSRYPAETVKSACDTWISTLDPQSADYEHHLLEALWVHQHHHIVNEPLLRTLLGSTDHRVRAAAAGVLRAWRENITEVTPLIEALVRDQHPRVRLSGALICSDIDSVHAAEMALELARMPRDKFLDYVLLETTRTLSPLWKQALAEGQPFCDDNKTAVTYLLRSSSPQELLNLPPQPHLLEGIVTFGESSPDERLASLQKLAELRQQNAAQVLLDFIQQADEKEHSHLPKLVRLLAQLDVESLRSAEEELVRLATAGNRSVTRQGALSSIVRIDASPERAWAMASKGSRGLVDVLRSVKRIPEAETRTQFYDPVRGAMRNAKTVAGSQTSAEDSAKIEAAAVAALAHIPGNEPQKLEDMIGLLELDRCRGEALAVIRTIPENQWQLPLAERLVAAALKHLATVAPSDRTTGIPDEEMKLTREFAGKLPESQRGKALATLESFSITVLELRTVPHRMAYDKQKMTVQAGSTVQLVFKNDDNMPHNFVLTRPGKMAEIGQIAEAGATQPDMIARQYVPKSRKVLLSSRLLQTQEEQVLDFQAPKLPGIYPFVCTYPGHWRRMFGALYVVEDVDAFEADPETYLALHSIKVRDDYLKFNRPLRKWTFEDLNPALDRLTADRNFDRGAALFQVASCAACHAANKTQSRFAPDLTKLDVKLKPADILREILEPSKTINEKYQTSQFWLDTGKAVSGLVTEENGKEVMLIQDPLASCTPVVIEKEAIEDREKSQISLMPVGLLDRFTEEEILELCAYVVARGDREASVYQQPGAP